MRTHVQLLSRVPWLSFLQAVSCFPVQCFTSTCSSEHFLCFISSASPLGKLTYAYCHYVKEKFKHTGIFWAQPWDHIASSKSTIHVFFPWLPRLTEFYSRRI